MNELSAKERIDLMKIGKLGKTFFEEIVLSLSFYYDNLVNLIWQRNKLVAVIEIPSAFRNMFYIS